MSDATPEQLRDLRQRARDFAKKSIVVEATARLVEQCLLEAHAHLVKPVYTDKQKEWMARYLLTGLNSRGISLKDDAWIKEVTDAFDVIENMKSET